MIVFVEQHDMKNLRSNKETNETTAILGLACGMLALQAKHVDVVTAGTTPICIVSYNHNND